MRTPATFPNLAEGVPLSRAALQEFSDLDPASLEAVARLWPAVPARLKHTFLDGLHDLADESTLVSFEDLARQLLSDPDGQVRLRAIRLLGESQDPRLAAAVLKILASDEDAETRREAAAALARFVELGELEEIPEFLGGEVVEAESRAADRPLVAPSLPAVAKARAAIHRARQRGHETGESSRKIRLVVATADPESAKGVQFPTEAEIAAKYEQAKESFRKPARVKLALAAFTPERFGRGVQPSDAEVKAYYDGNPDAFRSEEQRLVSRIVLPFGKKDQEAVRGKAAEILREASKGKAAFDPQAKRHSRGRGGESCLTRKDAGPELGPPLFSAPVDGVVGPVETGGNLVIAG